MISLLASRWTAAGWNVTICTFDTPQDRIYHPLDQGVTLQRLGRADDERLPRALLLCKRTMRLRRTLRRERPDVILSFLTKINALSLAATVGTGLKVVACERNNPAMQKTHPLWNRILAVLLSRADAFVVQTGRALEHVPSSATTRAVVIPNPIMKPQIDRPIDRDDAEQGSPFRLVAVGRLTEQKGFDLLIDAFSRVAGKYPDWVLDIWGEGADQARLQALIETSPVAGRIALRGVSARQGAWAEGASAFALSSRYEGFPNVLGEAMACGLSVVAFDCPFGPREMVQHGYDGMLVERENVPALARALERLMSDSSLRLTLGQNAAHSAKRFAPEHVATLWDALVRRMIDVPTRRRSCRQAVRRAISGSTFHQ